MIGRAAEVGAGAGADDSYPGVQSSRRSRYGAGLERNVLVHGT
jgi:hypothetical protein